MKRKHSINLPSNIVDELMTIVCNKKKSLHERQQALLALIPVRGAADTYFTTPLVTDLISTTIIQELIKYRIRTFQSIFSKKDICIRYEQELIQAIKSLKKSTLYSVYATILITLSPHIYSCTEAYRELFISLFTDYSKSRLSYNTILQCFRIYSIIRSYTYSPYLHKLQMYDTSIMPQITYILSKAIIRYIESENFESSIYSSSKPSVSKGKLYKLMSIVTTLNINNETVKDKLMTLYTLFEAVL